MASRSGLKGNATHVSRKYLNTKLRGWFHRAQDLLLFIACPRILCSNSDVVPDPPGGRGVVGGSITQHLGRCHRGAPGALSHTLCLNDSRKLPSPYSR